MLKSESLIQLVNNLTKQEKKEFSLYITNKSEKDYIFLFRLIDDKKISDPEELKKSFLTVKPTSSFNTVVVYLFDLLISILTRIRTEQDSYYLLFNELLHARVLYEKSMYKECFHLWNDPPVYYLMTVEGMLESLRIMHNYEGMDYFIEKLARLSSPSSSFQLNVTYVIFIYRLFSFIDVGNFKMAGTWVDEYQASLLDKILLLKEQQQAEISLYIALTHLGNGEYRKARKRLSTTIGRSHLYSLSLFRTIRIVNVMIHYELGDVDYIQSEVRSIKREMSKNKRHNLKVESFLLKFLNYSFTDKNQKKQVEIWKSVEEEIHALHEDKYEIQILRRFDFTAWVKAKIFNLSLGDVLSEKCNLAYK